jgi:NADH-quinone oxidoreductase subunit L
MTRQIFLVFFGQWRGGHVDERILAEKDASENKIEHREGRHHYIPHETPWNMTLPLIVLGIFALFLGWAGTPWLGGNLFHHFLMPEEAAPHTNDLVLWLSIGVGLLGIVLGYVIYGVNPLRHANAPDPLQLKLGVVFTWLKNKWYIDELYEATIIRATVAFARLFRFIDRAVVDGLLHAIVWATRGISQLFRWIGDEFFINGGFDTACETVRDSGGLMSRIQSGRVQNYFRVLGLGTAILLVVYFYFLNS